MSRISHESTRINQTVRWKLMIVLLAIVISADLFGQNITFQKAYTGPNIDYLNSVVQTPDNGYIAVGRIRLDFTNDFMYIMRLNSLGDTLWTKKINREEATSVTKTTDGYYALVGINGSFVKFDINGYILSIGSFFNEDLRIKKIITDEKGLLYICGSNFTGSSKYPYLACYTTFGELLWDTIYTSNSVYGQFTDMVFDSSDKIVLSGDHYTTKSGQLNIFLMKTNVQGNQLWFTNLGGYFYPNVSCVTKLDGGGYIVGGTYNDVDAFLAKFSSNGVFQWLKGYDTTLNSIAYSSTATTDGGLVYTGWIDSAGPDMVRIRKIDSNGVEVWSKLLGFPNHSHSAWNIKQTNDTGFVIVGRVDFQLDDAYILKVDKNGKLNPMGINVVNTVMPSEFKLYQNYPNPFNPATKIKFDISGSSVAQTFLSVYDINGKEISLLVNTYLKSGSYEVSFDAASLSSGVYFYKISAGSFTDVKKMVYLK